MARQNNRQLCSERTAWAAERLLACRSTSTVVAATAEHWGISRRQARRVVGAAHALLAEDLAGAEVDRKHLLAQLTAGLVDAMGVAIDRGHPSAAVGAAKQLQALLHLSAGESPLARDQHRWRF